MTFPANEDAEYFFSDASRDHNDKDIELPSGAKRNRPSPSDIELTLPKYPIVCADRQAYVVVSQIRSEPSSPPDTILGEEEPCKGAR
jgi:hypothetical protein